MKKKKLKAEIVDLNDIKKTEYNSFVSDVGYIYKHNDVEKVKNEALKEMKEIKCRYYARESRN